MSGQQYENASLNLLAAEIVKTAEFKNLLNAMISGLLDDWGAQGKIKSLLAKQARQAVVSRDEKNAGNKDMKNLLNDPDVITNINDQLPILLNGFVDISTRMAAHLENASEERQRAFFNDFMATFEDPKIGCTLSSLARIVEDLHQSDPTLFSDKIIQILGMAMKNMDFGELKIVFENSEDDFMNLGIRINDLLFEYPAKLILMLSSIPGLSNLLLVYLQDLIKRFNDLPADILTDLLISFFKDLDEKAAGRLLDNMAELIRQVHTGSALIGDGGSPQFSVELGQKFRAALDGVDMERFFKAANALVDGHEAIISQLYEAAGRDRNFIPSVLTHKMNKTNSKVRLARQRLELLEGLDQEEAASALAGWLAEWDAYDFAEWINSVCTMANLLHEHKPDAVRHGVTEFVNTLDLYEIQESVEWFSRDLADTLHPLIRTLAPVVVKDIFHCLESDTGEYGEPIDEMRQALRNFILNEGGKNE